MVSRWSKPEWFSCVCIFQSTVSSGSNQFCIKNMIPERDWACTISVFEMKAQAWNKLNKSILAQLYSSVLCRPENTIYSRSANNKKP